MKIIEEITRLSDTLKTSKKTSYFKEMLDSHLSEVRSGGTSSPSHWLMSQPNSQELKDLLSHIDKLKELDEGYYDTGIKKATLAENFAKRFGTDALERLGKFKPIILAKAKKYDLDPNFLAGLIKQESNFNPYAVSRCGAMGLGQLMPETARSLGVKDPFNASQNLEGAAKYLRQMLDTFGGNTDKALAAYNAGPGAVQKYGGIPPYSETQGYVRAIRGHRQLIAKGEFLVKNKAA